MELNVELDFRKGFLYFPRFTCGIDLEFDVEWDFRCVSLRCPIRGAVGWISRCFEEESKLEQDLVSCSGWTLQQGVV